MTNVHRCNRIIFLDFDGVLNADRVHDPLPAHILSLIQADIAREPILASLARQLDPVLVERLRVLVQHLAAGIVFSSSWRLLLEPEDMLRFFCTCFGFSPEAILGITPNCGLANRGAEIQTWIKNSRFQGEYLILDDMPVEDFLPNQRARLLQTDHRVGLSQGDVRRALALFGLPPMGG